MAAEQITLGNRMKATEDGMCWRTLLLKTSLCWFNLWDFVGWKKPDVADVVEKNGNWFGITK